MTIAIHDNILQGTPEWLALKCGKLSASNVKSIITPTKLEPANNDTVKNYAAQIAVERISGKCVDGIKTSAMQKGNDLEPEARVFYHNNFAPVRQIALMENSNISFPFCASPDALLINANGSIEIKSLSNTKEYFELLNNPTVENISIERKLQMASQQLAGGLDFVDFVIYVEGLKMHPIRYYRDEDLISKILIAGESFENMVQNYIAIHNNCDGILTPVIKTIEDTELW
jgi:hypothetical protein